MRDLAQRHGVVIEKASIFQGKPVTDDPWIGRADTGRAAHDVPPTVNANRDHHTKLAIRQEHARITCREGSTRRMCVNVTVLSTRLTCADLSQDIYLVRLATQDRTHLTP
jgi:hypothetical protein